MGWAESLQQAIDFMEENLLQEVTIEDIAKQANSSVFHFQRTFSILTDMAVGEYLRKRRLTLAAYELVSTSTKIIDLAYKYGYDTPEAFTKAFRRQHGVTPSEARKNVGKLQSYNRLVLQVNLKGAEPMNYKIVEKEAFQVVGIKREFSMDTEENMTGIPRMWTEANTDGTSDLLLQHNNGNLKALLGVCANFGDKRTMDYWIAAAREGEIPVGLHQLDIPASKWGVFEVHGAMPHAMQKVWKQIYSEWFPSNPYEAAGTAELEVYPPGDAYSTNYYSEIWIPLKRH
ncbi:AraC family transcriptional regulator [Planomicrobium sp. CPCC 101079]|uniref:AraC family transcriptional regulator n=1 Tax=Planomicrobium sp. CPCC 101079 TaxID=2599618 RepID=UPI0011B5E866|nr:AraC family transcriptional regulator [Planomicrobium sp. CPCC 101079]TWT13211.1 AraC family transcriptional regulator [Planomicrobium sp. CPCC 101079]